MSTTPIIKLGLTLADHALGQFERGYALAQSLFEGLNDHERRKTAHWATAAAWHMVSGDATRFLLYVAHFEV